jgi:hypothetical protein
MKTIREHEQNEWMFQHMRETIFWEDPKEDFSTPKDKQEENANNERKQVQENNSNDKED